MSKDKHLTPIQRRFVEEYAIDLNGAQAAIRAGYSPKTARSIASENLTRPGVRAAIRQRLQAPNGPPQTRLEELTSIAFADFRDELIPDPEYGFSVKPGAKLVRSFRRITRTDPMTGHTRKSVSVKFVDRAKALEELLERITFQ